MDEHVNCVHPDYSPMEATRKTERRKAGFAQSTKFKAVISSAAVVCVILYLYGLTFQLYMHDSSISLGMLLTGVLALFEFVKIVKFIYVWLCTGRN